MQTEYIVFEHEVEVNQGNVKMKASLLTEKKKFENAIFGDQQAIVEAKKGLDLNYDKI